MFPYESEVSSEYLERKKATLYAKHARKRPYVINDDLNEYDLALPKSNNKTASQLIEEKISEGIDPIYVLDVGCGKGRFLAEIMARYPQVKGFGISAFDYRD